MAALGAHEHPPTITRASRRWPRAAVTGVARRPARECRSSMMSPEGCYTGLVRRFRLRLLIAMTILGSAHYYVWLRFVAATELPAPWHALATVAIVALAPSLVVASLA